jgi:FKBP-type peptidyl-prolyl cis-trans isomerase/cold shock CspA family protein
MSMRSLKSAMDSEEYKSGLAKTKTKDYRDSLEEGYLEDEEFSRALAACQRALKDKRESKRRRELTIKLSVAGATVTAVVLLIVAGLWIRSSIMRASALADAVEQQNWDEALAIDSQHVPALIGRAKQRLNAGTPDIEGAFADIGLAEQVDSTAAELKPAKALAHAKKVAVQQAAAQKVAAEKAAAEKAAAEKAAAYKAAVEQTAAKKAAAEKAAAEKATAETTLTLKGHSDAVFSVSFSPDGKRIVSGSADKTLKVWDAQTGRETLKLNGHLAIVLSVSFSPDGKRIVSGSLDKTVKVWDAQTGQETLTLNGHSRAVSSVGFSRDGKLIVSGGDSSVKVWDVKTGRETLTLKGHSGGVTSVSFSPNGKQIVSGSGEYNKPGEIKIWNATTGEGTLTPTLRGHSHFVRSVSFSPDGTRIVSGGGEVPFNNKPGEVKVWDAQTGQETLTLRGLSNGVGSVSFSPDGKRIVSGSADKTVKVWDAQTGQETLTLNGHSSEVTSVSFSPDGKRIVSGSYDRSLKVWDISSSDGGGDKPSERRQNKGPKGASGAASKGAGVQRKASERRGKFGVDFLVANAKKKGVVTTKSGLQYTVLKAGKGATARATDNVEVHYRGLLIDGTVFDESFKGKVPGKGDETIRFPANRVIKGWTEALQLMNVGAVYRLVIPSELAYGARGAGQAIGPNAVLIFEVHLLNIRRPR